MKPFLAFLILALSCAVALAAELPANMTAREEIVTLRREIARHDELYHRRASPEISDADYDRLKRRLAELERAHPEAAKAAPVSLEEIGDDRSGLFQTQRHQERMLSLEKAYTSAELRAFHARVTKASGSADHTFVIEPKFDGLAVSVTYEKGKLVRAVTRGNGSEGDDVTANAIAIRGLPRELRSAHGRAFPELIELRGEIYVSLADFARLNEEQELAGERIFANPRNLAAGTMRQLDPRDVSRRELRAVFFGVGACEPSAATPRTQTVLHAALEAWGLPVVTPVWRATGVDELVAAIDALERARAKFDFPTDGAVVKVDSFALQRELGVGESAPRWAVAYKFTSPRAETQIRAITLQVGRTGVLTPVAELVPVQLGGSTIARATLHNRDELARKDIRVGDFVYVEKAGEIIPAVVGVDRERRPAGTVPFVFPSACPECGAPVGQTESKAAVRCGNHGCPAQLRRRLEHFASKDGVAIDGLGPATIETLVVNGWVKDLPDLYRLRRAELLTLGRNNEKSVDRLLAAIDRSKRAELWRVIHGLGVPGIGAVTAKDLARQCGSLATLVESGANVVTALREPRYRTLIAELISVGVGASAPANAATDVARSPRFAGKVFVLTGTLPTLTRAQAAAKIEGAGGKVSNSVSRTMHYLVVGAEPGAKLTQARELGVAIIDEAALLRMLQDAAP